MARGYWTYGDGRKGHKPPAHEKQAIERICEALIEDVLKPRYLPENRPKTFNS